MNAYPSNSGIPISQINTSGFQPAKTSSASCTDDAAITVAPQPSSTTDTNSRVSVESSTARILIPRKFGSAWLSGGVEYRSRLLLSLGNHASGYAAGIGNF